MLFWEVPYYSYSIMGPKNLILIIKAPMLGLRVQGGRRRVGVVVEGVLGDHEPETLCSMLVANKVFRCPVIRKLCRKTKPSGLHDRFCHSWDFHPLYDDNH